MVEMDWFGITMIALGCLYVLMLGLMNHQAHQTMLHDHQNYYTLLHDRALQQAALAQERLRDQRQQQEANHG